MTRDNDNQPEDHPEGNDDPLTEFARDPFKRTGEQELAGHGSRREQDAPGEFSEDYDDEFDDDPYDEPERDTAYPPAYREEEDDTEDLFEEQQPLLRATASTPSMAGQPDTDDYPEDVADDSDDQWTAPRLSATDADEWLDEPDYDEAQADEETDFGQRLPMALLIVAVVAVILLVAGGYGVMQERAESNDEIRQLRAALATAASSEDIDKARAEVDELRAQNNDLEDSIYDLQIENRKLTDLVAGLEAQIDATNSTPKAPTSTTVTPAPKPGRTPVQAPTPAPKAPAATPDTGSWFVNFGSYGQLSAAQSWQARLKPSAGEVITAPGERDGRTFFRVRVINLPDKAAADAVARALEKQYDLPRLWVGQQ